MVVIELERSVVEEIKKGEVSKSREKMYLIIEFFSKGNIILADKEMIIIAALEAQEWKDRKIKPREKYMFPPASVNYTHLSKEQLGEILEKSGKRNLVTSLATDLGIGGLYAEELCKISEVDKNKLPKEVDVKEVAAIYRALQELLKKTEVILGCVYAEEVTPFTLTGQEPLKTFLTYSEALDTLNPFQKVSPYEQKIKVIDRIIAEQGESVHHLEEQITENQLKGEWIYEHYPQVERLLNAVKEMRQTKEWKEVGEELKKIKKVASVDLKSKKVVVEG
ncbi:MAG: NFACT family protein [Nanoarchaeota archaeon]